ncbi:MAG: hypothetical protein Q7T71_06670 [Herbiconiux sp.]|nr:hypothetical protein [Herbiconiux sp.]
MTSVLITGSRAPVALELARHFAAAGCFVVTADSQPALTSASRAVARAYRVPSARFRPEEFARAIEGIAARHAVDLVVPTCEETFWLAAAVAANPARPLARLLVAPPLAALRRTHDKAAFAGLLAELGIPHPRTRVVGSGLELRRLAAGAAAGSGCADAVVLKPAFSRFGARTRVVAAGEPWPEVHGITRAQPWIVQEFVSGREFCCSAVAVDGRVTAFVAYEPVWRAGSGSGGGTGAGVAFDRLDDDDPRSVAARAAVERLAEHASWTGQLALDLIERAAPAAPAASDAHHGSGGEILVLEANPRATSGLHLFAPSDALADAFLAVIPAHGSARVVPTPPTPAMPSPTSSSPVSSGALSPSPTTPSPTMSSPMSSSAVSSGAVSPSPTTPSPVSPNPATRSPVSPNPATRSPVSPNPAMPSPVSPSPATLSPTSSSPVSSGAVLPSPVSPEALMPARASRRSARLAVPHVLYAARGMRSLADVRRFVRQLAAPDALSRPGDRIPLAVLVRSLAVQARAARTNGVTLTAASTADIEWNGEPYPSTAAEADRTAEWASEFVRAAEAAGGARALAPNTGVALGTLTVGQHTLPYTVPADRRALHIAPADRRFPQTAPGDRRTSLTANPGPHRAHAGTAASGPPSYVVSPVTHYLRYAREELAELRSPVSRRAAGALLRLLDLAFSRAGLDETVLLGNALLSTNLLPALGEREVEEATRTLRRSHPGCAIAWRSVHGRALDGDGLPLAPTLRRAGYRLIPARSILFTPTSGTAWSTVRDTVRDRRLLERGEHRLRAAPVDAATGMSPLAVRERIAELYTQLYVEKYSRLNPRYTAAFIGAAQRSGLLTFRLLERRATETAEARIDGAFGFTAAHGYLAAPVLGYDTGLPQSVGLYRMLSYAVAAEAHAAGLDLHNSSGVAAFKRSRGAEPELEYLAVHTRHLPPARRLAWWALDAVVTRVAVPLVQHDGL